MTSRKAFTLIEILVAVMLTGMLMTFALAPVMVTVRRVVETQEEYADLSALSRVMNFIARDLNSAMRMSANVIMIIDHEAMGGNDDDALLIMSTSPTAQNLPSGTLVYKISEGGLMHNNAIAGLYRWIFPGRLPNSINVNTLDIEAGQLVLPGVNEFCVEIPTSSNEDDRRKEYSGQLPSGLYIKIGRKKEQDFSLPTINDKDNNLDELESVIVFP